ncbi:MAG TPA: MFS transporter [Steroidobacteraceae bacterium]|nr:MFS transporter [Steroidobacteraceae bacterium]
MTSSLRESPRARRYRTYLLGLLGAIYAFNYLDYQAISLVLQNIKTTFNVTDAELGFLTGIAFTLFYATLGVPIGRWADRGNRVAIIALTLGLRSVMVMLSGATRTFGELLLVRIGVAAGEAGCLPPALSLIADYFSPAERPRAVAIYLLGFPLSVLAGFFIGGWLNELYGWRMMFVLMGAPGLVLMIIAFLTLDEPRLRTEEAATGLARVSSPDVRAPPVSEVCRALWGNRTFLHVLAAFCVNYFFGTAVGQWQPAFFIRSFGFNTLDLGILLALIFGGAGAIGTYFGGYVASRYAPGNAWLQLRVLAVLNVAFGVISAFSYLSGSAYASLALTGLAFLGVSVLTGPLFAAVQTVVPQRMVGTAIAVIMLTANLVGAGLGPMAVGTLSDALRSSVGTESLRFALLATCPGFVWGAWHLWRAARTVASDTEAASRLGSGA